MMECANRPVAATVLASLLIAVGCRGAHARAGTVQARGETVFTEKCGACHTLGGGPLVGPDLKGVTERREPGWLRRFIREPDKLLAAGDPIGKELLGRFNNVPMPNMGLTEGEVEAVVAYLGAAAGTGSQNPAPEAVSELERRGDGNSGREFFTGSVSFKNGGPPCIGCHSVGGLGALGGGTLGPDLTSAHGRFGEAGLAGVLQSLPFPTMRPVYAERPLTGKEQADLLAFLAQAAGVQEAAGAPGTGLLAAALGSFLVLAVLPGVVWRNRFRGVRQRLAGGSR